MAYNFHSVTSISIFIPMQQTAQHLLDTLDKALPLLKKISDETASAKPKHGKWSYKEIIGHLVDSAANNHQKFVRTIQEDGLKFPPYEQEAWVRIQQYNEADWHQLLQLWDVYNRHLAHIIGRIPDAALPNQIAIGKSEPFSLDFIVRDYPEHLKHHLRAILPDADFLQNNFKMVY